MKTLNRHYLLPNKNHDVVDDINGLRSTFVMIDGDVKNTEEKIEKLSETVSDLENRAVHCPTAIENSEIQNFSANRYLVVNQTGNGFECLDGGGDAGGSLGQCSIKKSDASFDTAWGNILEISKNGMTTQENSETGQSNETHIFVNDAEIENDEQLPKVELTNCRAKSDFDAENNESIIFCDEIEEIADEIPIATHENFGLVKIGDGFEVDEGTISASIISKATTENAGTVKIGDGIKIENGIISRKEINPATFSNFGVVKLGENLAINSAGEMEISDMTNNATIYNFGKKKICFNGIIELEEDYKFYRVIVNEDLVISFNTLFEAQDDFSFVVEIISDGTHLISIDENLNPAMNQLAVNRGITRLFFNKKIGVPIYEITVSKLDCPDPVLLTQNKGDRVNSEFLMYAPNGGTTNPYAILSASYKGITISELNWEFETIVSVDYVNYVCRYSNATTPSFIFRGSVDGKNWTTLIHKENENCYGKNYTENKGCFRYYNLQINYSNNYPGGVLLYGTQIDKNESELINLVPYMSSDSTAFATFTASTVSSGGATQITDNDLTTYTRITSDANSERWIKYELDSAEIANFLELNFYNTNTQTNWFKLEGSNDDTNYDLLLEKQYYGNEIFSNGYRTLYFRLQNETAYKFYKLTCLATNDSSDNWDLYGFHIYNRKNGKQNFHRGIPYLTELQQDGYILSASSQFDAVHATKYACDGNPNTKWAVAGNGVGAWLQLKLPAAQAFNGFQISSRGDGYIDQTPKDFQLQVSNDGENWTSLIQVRDAYFTAVSEYKTFQFENENAYLYYRLYIEANNGNGDTALGEFVLGNCVQEYKRELHKYDSLIPILSSDNDQGYKTSASSVLGDTAHPAYCAFDGSTNAENKWLSAANDTTSAWLKIELPTASVANAFLLQMPNEMYRERSPKNFEIQGSNDGSSWTTLVTQSDLAWATNQARTFSCENSTAYKFYRIYITASNGGTIVHIGEWKLYHDHYVREY